LKAGLRSSCREERRAGNELGRRNFGHPRRWSSAGKRCSADTVPGRWSFARERLRPRRFPEGSGAGGPGRAGRASTGRGIEVAGRDRDTPDREARVWSSWGADHQARRRNARLGPSRPPRFPRGATPRGAPSSMALVENPGPGRPELQVAANARGVGRAEAASLDLRERCRAARRAGRAPAALPPMTSNARRAGARRSSRREARIRRHVAPGPWGRVGRGAAARHDYRSRHLGQLLVASAGGPHRTMAMGGPLEKRGPFARGHQGGEGSWAAESVGPGRSAAAPGPQNHRRSGSRRPP